MTTITPACLRTFFALAAVLLVAFTASATGTENLVYSFNPVARGNQPSGGLVADAAGNLYGTTSTGGAFNFGTVFKLTPESSGGWIETVLHSFGGGVAGGAQPLGSIAIYASSPTGPLLFDSAGNLYGTTVWGGKYGYGTVFELQPNGSGTWTEITLYSFTGSKDGSNPNGGLVFDQAGNLYGTTFSGGGEGREECINGGCGAVFKLAPGSASQWTESVLYAFRGSIDGADPAGSLALDEQGNLYGTTDAGGDISSGLGYGVVFEIAPSKGSWREIVLYTFTGGSDGEVPKAGVILDEAGNLYGTTSEGGDSKGCSGYPCGTVFQLTPGSSGSWIESVIHNFQGSDGQYPKGTLTLDQAGNLYGTTAGGTGATKNGTVFQLTPGFAGQWTEKLLWSFTGSEDGEAPNSNIILGPDGRVYTPASSGGSFGHGSAIELTPNASGPWNETTLTGFPPTDGGDPQTNLVADTAGNLYGTASIGGTYGYGAVFKLTKSSGGSFKETILYSFNTGASLQVGAVPSALTFDSAGNLYGETAYGGEQHLGTVFKLSPNSSGGWIEKTLYNFTEQPDGTLPYGGLVFDKAGNLYGTTRGGGNTGCGYSCGTVFELAPASGGTWNEMVLYRFAGGSDGSHPISGLVFDAAGNLYGTTPDGGTSNQGTVYELSPGSRGWTETQLYLFTGQHGDGYAPMAGLVFDQAGNLYGTTSKGGSYAYPYCSGPGCGTVFKLSPASGGWNETVLLEFTQVDGSYPASVLILDSIGNLYGTTQGGLGYVWGTAYELSPASGGNWAETVFHVFPLPGVGDLDGYLPLSGLVRDSLGNLYGTTVGGGPHNGGIVFEITP